MSKSEFYFLGTVLLLILTALASSVISIIVFYVIAIGFFIYGNHVANKDLLLHKAKYVKRKEGIFSDSLNNISINELKKEKKLLNLCYEAEKLYELNTPMSGEAGKKFLNLSNLAEEEIKKYRNRLEELLGAVDDLELQSDIAKIELRYRKGR